MLTFDTLDTASFTAGTYVFRYTCTDEAGLSDSKCRTIVNQDHTLPVVTVKTPIKQAAGCDSTEAYCVATSAATYVDEGAFCSDQVDGQINFNVVAKGDIVDTTTVGTYVIQYECEDEAGNDSSETGATRTVIVFDTICPTCAVSVDGSNSHTVEASFPLSASLKDDVNCTDDANGDVTVATQTGDVADVELTGTYIITYTVTDGNNNTNFIDRNGVACTICDQSGSDDHALTADACATNSQKRTIIVVDTLAPIITIAPALMAESTQVNGWALGAIASAISGIALVGFGASRKSVATSVPV